MAFSNIHQTKNVLTFDIKNVDVSIVNSLRRIIIAEVPTIALAFDPLSDKNPDITIHKNLSALHNEFLAHRLSLIPIHLNPDEVESFRPNEYVFRLKVKNNSSEIVSVTTRDIKIYNDEGKLYDEAFHHRVFPADSITKNHILITKLRPNIYNPENGEEIDIEFKANKNIAKNHSRWSPVSCCTFFNQVDENAADIALEKTLDEAAAAKSRQLTSVERTAITNKFNTLDRFRHFEQNKYGEASAFHFKIESECGLPPSYIFRKAFNVLIDKLRTFSSKLGTQDLPVRKLHENQFFYELAIQGEDYTLLNVLQCCIYNHEKRDKKESSKVEYIGYYQPHPLDEKMILKVKFIEDVDIHVFMRESVEKIIQELTVIREKWPKST